MRDSTWSFIYLESSMKYKDTNIWKTALQVLSFMMKVVRIMSWVCFLKPHLSFAWSSAGIDGVFSQYYHEPYRNVIYHEAALIFFEPDYSNKPCTCVLESICFKRKQISEVFCIKDVLNSFKRTLRKAILSESLYLLKLLTSCLQLY